MKTSTRIWNVATASLVAMAATVSAQEFNLKFVGEGGGTNFGGYMPTHVTLSAEAPATVKKAPGGLKAPLYGTLKLGPTENQTSVGIIVDEPTDGAARLFVDANGDGDFQNDPPAKWTSTPRKRQDGSPSVLYMGDGTVNVQFGTETLPMHFKFYRFDKDDPARAALKLEFFYYRDYAQKGEIKLGGKTYRVALDDLSNRGTFMPKASDKQALVKLWIDVNGDGKFDPAFESWDLNEPFNIKGKSYIATVASAQGNKLQIAPSKVEVAERLTQDVGDKVLTFEARTTKGDAVAFPGDFKGKLVMLDFWATWCKPCVGEMPNLSAVYKDYHGKGFEVLGVSLDDKIPAKEVEDFALGKGLTWNQIYEGGQWNTRLAKYFTVHSIPHTLLVDGDTGMILATDRELRGEELAPTLDKQLAAKKAKN